MDRMTVRGCNLHRSQRLFTACGVCVLFAFLPPETTAAFLLSAAAHEAGHAAVMRLLGIPVGGLRMAAGGAVLRGDFLSVPYRHELLAAAAGPAVNILLAVLTAGVCPTGSNVNVLLAVYNLLPLSGNDGAVMLGAAADIFGHGDAARRCLRYVGAVLYAVLLMFCAWVFWYGALLDTDGRAVGYGSLFFCLFVRMRNLQIPGSAAATNRES